jgi:hypothetical protein
VNTWVGHQVGLELVQIDIQSTIEAKRRSNGRDDLGNQTVEVLKARAGDVQVPPADVVDSLVVDQERAVRVLNGAVRRQDGIVGLDDGGRDTGRRVDGELELRLLSVVGRETLEEESTEAGARAAAEGVEDQEALKAAAVVC